MIDRFLAISPPPTILRIMIAGLALPLAAACLLGCAGEPRPAAPPPWLGGVGGPYAPAQRGYVATPYLASLPPPRPSAPDARAMPSAAALAVSYALRHVGAPYCWGGVGPGCFDCSGLTRAAWLAGGKSIPRTSELQAAALPAIALDHIELGDIAWRPGHVGIYIGRGLVVNATRTGDVVRVQPLSGYVRALRP